MTNDQQLITFLQETQHWLAEEKVYHENGIREHKDQIRKIDDLDRRLALLRLSSRPAGDSVAYSKMERVVIANGQRLDIRTAMLEKPVYSLSLNGRRGKATESEVRSMNPKDFAVYLDVTTGVLASRLPGEESRIETIEKAGLSGVEDILGVLLENPHLNFGNVNISVFLPHRAGMTPDAFRKAMARIRNAIQGGDEDGPLLRRINRSHFSISDSGFAWRMSMDAGDLCFIRFLLPPERFRRKRRRSAAGAIVL